MQNGRPTSGRVVEAWNVVLGSGGRPRVRGQVSRRSLRVEGHRRRGSVHYVAHPPQGMKGQIAISFPKKAPPSARVQRKMISSPTRLTTSDRLTTSLFLLEGVAVAAYRAQSSAWHLLRQRAVMSACAISETSVVALRLARSGQTEIARSMLRDAPRLAETCPGNDINCTCLLALHAGLLQETAAEELRDIDMALESDIFNTGRRQRARRRLDPYHIARKGLDLSGLHAAGGTLFGNPRKTSLQSFSGIGSRSSLAVRSAMPKSSKFANSLVVDAELGQLEWHQGRRRRRQLACRAVHQGLTASRTASEGSTCPTPRITWIPWPRPSHWAPCHPSFTRSCTDLIPKGEYEEDKRTHTHTQSDPQAAGLRPLKLMQTCAKLAAAVVVRKLSKMVEHTLCAK